MTIKTPAEIGNEIVNALSKGGSIQFAGLGRVPNEHEMTRAVATAAIEADRAQRSAGVEYWARDAADAMFSDKSNDWSEELAELRVILAEPNGWLDA